MMELKMSTVVIGTSAIDNRDQNVWTFTGKDSKAKTILMKDGTGFERSFGLATVNKHFTEQPQEPEIEEDQPQEVAEAVQVAPETEKPKKERIDTIAKMIEVLNAVPAVTFTATNRVIIVRRGKEKLFEAWRRTAEVRVYFINDLLEKVSEVVDKVTTAPNGYKENIVSAYVTPLNFSAFIANIIQ